MIIGRDILQHGPILRRASRPSMMRVFSASADFGAPEAIMRPGGQFRAER